MIIKSQVALIKNEAEKRMSTMNNLHFAPPNSFPNRLLIILMNEHVDTQRNTHTVRLSSASGSSNVYACSYYVLFIDEYN